MPLQEVDAASLGDYSRALYGTLDYGKEHTLFVQAASLLIRISAASLEADHTADAIALMEVILARIAGTGTVMLAGLYQLCVIMAQMCPAAADGGAAAARGSATPSHRDG